MSTIYLSICAPFMERIETLEKLGWTFHMNTTNIHAVKKNSTEQHYAETMELAVLKAEAREFRNGHSKTCTTCAKVKKALESN